MEELALSDYFAILRRWKKLFLTVFLIVLALAAVVTMKWSKYQSTATVQIEQPEISSTATTPLGAQKTMEALVDQRISEIQQRVLSTSSLIEIITKFNLYSNERKSRPIADVVSRMRKKIRVDLVSGTLANPSAANRVSADQLAAIAFNLSFTYPDPLLAQQTTDELVSRFLDEDLKSRRTQTEETSSFLAVQIEEMEKSLTEQEKKIAEYQKEHGVTRPENLAFNQQAAATLTLNLQNIDTQIASTEGQLGALRAQIAAVDPYSRVIADGQVLTTPSVQLKALQAQYATLTAQYGADHPDVVKTKRQIESLQMQVGGKSKGFSNLKAQITDLRTNLDAAQKTYGPEHPDVVALKSQLNSLEDQLATHRRTTPTAESQMFEDADNPAYLQLASQLRAAEAQRKAQDAQRKALMEQLSLYQKAITENPAAAQEMASLTRDYENAQLRYRELKAKKMSADMEEALQKGRKGARMSLINPPELPLHTSPRRILIAIAGFMFASICGLGAVIIAQILGGAIIGAHHLESVVGVPPLVVIPHLTTKDERNQSWTNKLCLLKADLLARLHSNKA